MRLSEEIELYFWSFTMSMLVLFIVLSLLIYRTNKNKMYLYYGLYCLFTVLYLSLYNRTTSISPFLNRHNITEFTVYIQFWFHALYLHFGVRFLGFEKHYPRFLKFIRVYVLVFLGLATSVFLLQNMEVLPLRSVRFSFYNVFVPIHLCVAFLIIYKSLKTKEDGRFIFLTGSSFYIIFVMIALFSSNMDGWKSFTIQPMVYFMLGVIVECLLISYGLGYKIRKLYFQRQLVQEQLNTANAQLKVKLDEEIMLREKETQLLQEQKQRQELKARLASLQQKVLRSQINSHFVFNVLNSIKVFIMDNDTQSAATYLNKFARFIRMVLDGNIKDHVTLAEELETLELFLSIENMRFGGRFFYRFEIDESVDLNSYSVPALILQPFVENALWHGIMNKEGIGLLIIKGTRRQNGLLIEIDDNGVGYKTALAKKRQDHKPVGINIVKERISQFNLHAKTKISFSIYDKSDRGSEEGTLVEVWLKDSLNKD